jgi:hypothetical protein
MENLHALFAQNLVAGQMVAVAGFVLLALVERFDYNNSPLQLGLQGYVLQLYIDTQTGSSHC